jgi:hypothetical protein
LSDDKPTTWYYDSYSKKVMHTGGAEYGDSSITKSIIAHRPLPNSGYAIIKGVPLLPPLPQGDNVEELAKHRFRKSDYEIQLREEAYIAGYNEAKEKYKYTEEDLRVVIFTSALSPTDDLLKRCDEIIKRLQQPSRPTHFEYDEYQELCLNCEWQHDSCPNAEDCLKPKPKTTTNSQGQVELIGKYI